MKLAQIVVLISGSGTNLAALLEAIRGGRLPARIILVVSNRKAAYGLARAEEAGIRTLYWPLGPYRAAGHSREQYDAALASQISVFQPDLIVMAGWMHIFGPAFLEQFTRRVINLHPALPGQFAGTHAIERAYAAFQRGEIRHSGCMVHFAVPEVDAGELIAQEVVPIQPTDSLSDFETRMHQSEHRLIVEATRQALGLHSRPHRSESAVVS